MKRRMLCLAALLTLWSTLAAAQTADGSIEPGSYLDRAFTKGETLEFSLAWLKVVGGSASMTLEPVGNGGDRLKIRSEARSSGVLGKIYPVEDIIESLVDAKDFATVRFFKELNERKRHKEELTVIDYDRGVALRKGKEVSVERPLLDPLSSIYFLRKFDLPVGKSYSFTIIADGKIYTLVAEVLRKETIETAAGVFSTVVVEPKMRHGAVFGDDSNRLLIWYTDDARHIPVRIRSDISAGSITATLRESRLGK